MTRQHRLRSLREKLNREHLDAMLVTSADNRYYFSGFTGTAGVLLIGPEHAYLVTDSRYVEQARQQAPDFDVQKHHGRKDYLPLFNHLLNEMGARRVGFEADDMSVATWRTWTEGLSDREWVEVSNLSLLRMRKDDSEIEHIRRATRIAEQAFAEVLKLVEPGITEHELAAELEYRMRKSGAEKPSFDLIVASGPRSAMPHGVASQRKIEEGDFITFDFGCMVSGYASDETRTVVLGKASERQKEVYRLVLEAQLAALAALAPGKTTQDIDRIARSIIENQGYGDYFGHGLGHGLGINIHEAPSLSPAGEVIQLEPGMVVTVEPGIYLPEWGGVRIEDAVVITETGYENLAAFPKELLELPIH